MKDGNIRQGFSILESNNWYSYVSNTPVKYIDPTGMDGVYSGILMANKKFFERLVMNGISTVAGGITNIFSGAYNSIYIFITGKGHVELTFTAGNEHLDKASDMSKILNADGAKGNLIEMGIEGSASTVGSAPTYAGGDPTLPQSFSGLLE